ncbi:MAG: transmembrane 220 family protein [Burkholderiales bacterium]
MRYVHILLGLLMVTFAAVQYNDPDAPLWIVIYFIPAAWAFAAAFRPAFVRSATGERLLWATVAVGAGTLVYYWPAMPGFWHQDVWRVEETAREGMGVMIGFAVLVVVLAATLLRRRPG